MGIPQGAQITEDGDHYVDPAGGHHVEIDHASAVEHHEALGVSKYSGEDASEWRGWFNAALQGTTSHTHLKPAAQVRLASEIADHMMHYVHRAREGWVAAVAEVKAGPDFNHDMDLNIGSMSFGVNSVWYQSALTSIGSFAQNSTNADSIAHQTATIGDEAFHQDLESYNLDVLWRAYDHHRKY